MSSFLLYCKPDNVGDPVDYLASNQFDRLQAADEVWGVTFRAGNLVLQAHLQVSSIEDRAGAERALGHTDLWDSKLYAIAEPPGERRGDISITEVAADLRFDGDVERLPEQWTPQSLQTMRRLTEESAGRLRQMWDSQAGRPAKRNPVWERDELILALDLYFRLERRVPDDGDPEVIALSELLNALPIHSDRPHTQRFRNPNGVALKLANFVRSSSPDTACREAGNATARCGRSSRAMHRTFVSLPTPFEPAT